MPTDKESGTQIYSQSLSELHQNQNTELNQSFKQHHSPNPNYLKQCKSQKLESIQKHNYNQTRNVALQKKTLIQTPATTLVRKKLPQISLTKTSHTLVRYAEIPTVSKSFQSPDTTFIRPCKKRQNANLQHPLPVSKTVVRILHWHSRIIVSFTGIHE